ncbi:helix-turn-helix domain-containing protein [Pseudonocardia broussonetiae]|uniref:Helix-turn-helix domain-containing protein n=1 Tax=Pseudonocardia broussonetiae TaxID=2736640 RepID=A0A6M6JU60_9PSEU|nr:helix-turn-helix domain-containing protein [Pseudonocardia broussonetiae]
MAEEGGCTLTQIAARSGLPLSTVHRLVTELAGWQVLVRDEDGRYGAGPPLAAVASARPPAPLLDLRERAVPVMEELFRATASPVRVGVLEGTAVSYVEKTSRHRPVTRLSPAARLPAHATALGKALLAVAPTRTLEAVLRSELRRYTPGTITRPERLRWLLRTVRMSGLALCDRELDPTGRAVAAPVVVPSRSGTAAIEVAVSDLGRDVPSVRTPLALAAAWLSRELAVPVEPAARLSAAGGDPA